ncbi:MAG: hypothetical protein JSR39_08700 [Verrucomicrobia bacterium]|nr:hypothetical protein [Verrucomicrobiota bacterium]
MKPILFILVFLAHLISSHTAMACTKEGVINLEKKIYVEKDQIKLDSEKIYVELGGLIYETPVLHSDADGYYIDQVAKSGSCSWFEWECSRCGFCNLRGIDWECGSCGRSISQ